MPKFDVIDQRIIIDFQIPDPPSIVFMTLNNFESLS